MAVCKIRERGSRKSFFSFDEIVRLSYRANLLTFLPTSGPKSIYCLNIASSFCRDTATHAIGPSAPSRHKCGQALPERRTRPKSSTTRPRPAFYVVVTSLFAPTICHGYGGSECTWLRWIWFSCALLCSRYSEAQYFRQYVEYLPS